MALFSMSQQYLLLCIKRFLKYIQRIFISTLLMWNVLLPTAFESVRMRGLVAFYSLWSIKAQTQLEIGECETSSGVLLLCLVHTPVLVTADQIQNRNVLVFVFFSSDHLGLLFFLWVLSAAKKTVWVSYSNLPAILGVAFGICPALVSAFLLSSTSSPAPRKDVRTD